MMKKTTVSNIAFALAAGIFLGSNPASTWAFDEKTTKPSVLEQWNTQQQQPSLQTIPQQQGSDLYPNSPTNDANDPRSRKPMADGKVCYGECQNAQGGRYVWKCGWVILKNGKYYIDDFPCKVTSCDGKCPNTIAQEKENNLKGQTYDPRAQ
jgi:hypothetical protein